MGPLSYFIALICIALGGYYWYTNNQLKQQVKDSSRTDVPIQRKSTKSKEKFLEFDRDCEIRMLTASDLESINKLIKGKGGCLYFKDHSLESFLNESNKECLGFGVEHKETKTIMCTQFIIMVDKYETGIVVGAMFDTNYLDDKRIIYMRLSNEMQSKLSVMFDHLGKYRCIDIKNNQSYMNNNDLDWKIKFNLDFKNDNTYYLLQNNIHNKDDLDGIKVNGDFKECDDIDNVINILQNKFKICDVLLDWKLLNVKYLKNVFENDIKNKKLIIMINHDETGLCLVYGDHDYYIYGITSKNVLSGVRFAITTNTMDDLGGIFVKKIKVDNDESLQKIFGKAMENPIVALDYDMHIDGH
eukprot:171774_1